MPNQPAHEYDENMQKRIENLFEGEELPSYLTVQQVEGLKKRITELENKLSDSGHAEGQEKPGDDESGLRSEPEAVNVSPEPEPLESAPVPGSPYSRIQRISTKILLPSLMIFFIALALFFAYNFYTTQVDNNAREAADSQQREELFNSELDNLEKFALGLAMQSATNPDIQLAFAERDREELLDLTLESYKTLDAEFDIPQYQFHLAPAVSFLRLHNIANYGDDLSSFRNTVLQVNETLEPVAGLEVGRGGMGMRGIMPMFYEGKHIGSVEFGLNIDDTFTSRMKEKYGSDWRIILTRDSLSLATLEDISALKEVPGSDNLLVLASTIDGAYAPLASYTDALNNERTIARVEENELIYSITTLPLHNYKGDIIGAVEIINDRTAIVNQQAQRIFLMLAAMLIALVAGSLSLSRTTNLALNPLTELTLASEAIERGDLSRKVKIASQDEIGQLGHTFNRMTAQLQNLIGSLEQRVAERTHDLELAAVVGRTITEKVNSVDAMLSEAAEMIRSRFDLYYTQVYLVDPFENTLRLRAGTGDVGRQLLARGHRLRINQNSINGRAVSEKQAVVVSDTAKQPFFLPNDLLPDTRSEMAVPLIVGGDVVGVLDMQSVVPNALNEFNLPAFEVLSGQLAVAIQNANLFEDAADARVDLEERARRQSYLDWSEFLNAVDRNERIGFSYRGDKVHPISSEEVSEFSIDAPLQITGAEIGKIQISSEAGRIWSESELQIVQETAAQLSRHIDNLRLLAQADKFRKEAEFAVKRLTREGWDQYLQIRQTLQSGFAYDQNQVMPIEEAPSGNGQTAYTHPITVRDELIGELGTHAPRTMAPAEAESLIQQVAGRLSAHIENLRLLEQAERRRLEIEESEARLSEALDIARLANWEYDVEKDLFTFNDQFYSIFHCKAEDVGGYQLSSAQYAQLFVYPDDMPLVGAEIGKALNSTERLYTTSLEHRIVYTDGSMGYISVNVNVERDENGKVTRFFGANQDITERKLAEEAIRTNQERLAEALNIARLGNWEYDVEKDLFTFNDQFYSIFHTTVEKVGSYQISSAEYAQKFVHPNDMALVGGEIGKALNSTEQLYTALLEHRIIYADGGVGYITVNVNVERDETGKIIRFYGANQDITERKLAEELIRTNETRLSEALDIAHLGNWEYDFEKDLFTFNDNFYSIFRTNVQEVGSYQISSAEYARRFVHPDDAPLVGEEIGKAITTTERFFNQKLEHRIIFADGTIGYISVNIHVERDENGKIVRWYGANQDITDRRLAENIIAERANQLETVATVSTTASTVLNPDALLQTVVDLTKERFSLYHAHIYLADEAWNTLLLSAGAGEVGRKMVSAGHAIQMDAQRSLVARASRERHAVIVNDIHTDVGFLPNPFLPDTHAEMAVPMIVGDKVLGVFDVQSEKVGFFTEEDALIYNTLAAQVAVALQNARLYQEQSATLTQLRELDRLKSSFLANMSHELRTPLNSILGFTDVMLEGLDGSLTPYMQNDLSLIQKNGQHLLHLINDVLDMAKIESGKLNLVIEKFNLQEVVEEVISITSPLANEKKINIEIDTNSDQEVEVSADRTRLRQVLLNLVNNAAKFTDKGRITIRALREANNVLISVRDTGIGIPPTHLESIFQEFTQVDSSTTRKAGGTGLGLPISRRLIQMHGGRLWAESTGIEGEGSTFYVFLPLEAKVAEPEITSKR